MITLEEAGASQWGTLLQKVKEQRNITVSVQLVRATTNKRARAEPISGFWQQGKAHLVGAHPDLESEMVTVSGEGREPSPDLLDALVWACWPFVNTRLGESGGNGFGVTRYPDTPSANPAGVIRRGTNIEHGGLDGYTNPDGPSRAGSGGAGSR